ncbi:hypothetical protein GCM10018966_081470 [Streptomyces yanii]
MLTISDELQACLASSRVIELRAAAEQWAETNGFGDAGPLGDLLSELSAPALRSAPPNVANASTAGSVSETRLLLRTVRLGFRRRSDLSQLTFTDEHLRSLG